MMVLGVGCVCGWVMVGENEVVRNTGEDERGEGREGREG